MLQHRISRTLHGNVSVGAQGANLFFNRKSEHRAKVFHQAHLISQLLATESVANMTIKLCKRARHRVNVNGAHGEASLNGLLGDKLVFPLLEHQLDLMTEFTHTHHQFMHHAVEARISTSERRQRPTNTQEQLAADLHG